MKKSSRTKGSCRGSKDKSGVHDPLNPPAARSFMLPSPAVNNNNENDFSSSAQAVQNFSILQFSQQESSANACKQSLYFILFENNSATTNLAKSYDKCIGLKKQWIKISELGSPSALQAGCIYVLDKFEGPEYDFIAAEMSKRTLNGTNNNFLLIGPSVLDFMLSSDLDQIPSFGHPIFNLSMRGVCMSSTGFRTEEDKKTLKRAVEYMELMGGHFVSQLTQATTHLLAKSVLSEKSYSARALNIPLLRADWVFRVWEDSRKSNGTPLISGTSEEYIEAFSLPLFYDLCFTFSQISPAKVKNQLILDITSRGGTYKPTLIRTETSILICSKGEGEKYRHAKQWGIPTVYPDWIRVSIDAGYAIKYETYLIGGPDILFSSTPNGPRIHSNGRLIDVSCIPAENTSNTAPIHVTMTGTVVNFIEETLETNETLCRTKSDEAASYFKQTRVYLAMSERGGGGGGGSDEEESRVKKLVERGGGVFETILASSTTHLVVGRGGEMSKEELAQLNKLKTQPYMTTLQWVLDSAQRQQKLPEENYIYHFRTPPPNTFQKRPTTSKPTPPPIETLSLRTNKHCEEEEEESSVNVRSASKNRRAEEEESAENVKIKRSTDRNGRVEEESAKNVKAKRSAGKNGRVEEEEEESAKNVKAKRTANRNGHVEEEESAKDMKAKRSANRNGHVEEEESAKNVKAKRSADKNRRVEEEESDEGSANRNESCEEEDENKNERRRSESSYEGGISENTPPPLVHSIFSGKGFCVWFEEKGEEEEGERVSETLESVGGVLKRRGGDEGEVDFLIVPPVYKPPPSGIRRGVPTYTIYWVLECDEKGTFEIPLEPYHVPFVRKPECSKILKGCVIVISSYPMNIKNYAVELAKSMGARVEVLLTRKATKSALPCTHLISPDASNEKFQAAKRWKVPVVTYEWLVDSYKEGRIRDVEEYLTERVRDESMLYPETPLAKGAHSSHFSRPLSSTLGGGGGGGSSTYAGGRGGGGAKTMGGDRDGFVTPVRPAPSISAAHARRLSLASEIGTPGGGGGGGSENLNDTYMRVWNAHYPSDDSFSPSEIIKQMGGKIESPLTPRLEQEIYNKMFAKYMHPPNEPSSKSPGGPKEPLRPIPLSLPPSSPPPPQEAEKVVLVEGGGARRSKRRGGAYANSPALEGIEGGRDEEEEGVANSSSGQIGWNIEEDERRKETLALRMKQSSGEERGSQGEIVSKRMRSSKKVEECVKEPIFAFNKLTASDKETYSKIIRGLGGKIIESDAYEPEITYLISTSLSRSEKILSSIAAGKPILKPSYIVKSHEAKRFLPINDYLFREEDCKRGNEIPIAVAILHWYNKKGSDLPFSGKSFVIIDSQNPVESYKRVLRAGGGTVLETEEGLRHANIIISSEEDIEDLKKGLPAAEFERLRPKFRSPISISNTIFLKDSDDCI